MSLTPSLFQDQAGMGGMSGMGGTFAGMGGSPMGGSAAVDVVAIYGKDMDQLFPMARPAKATVMQSAKLAEHPVESGGTIVDNRVILPVEIEMTFYVTEYESTYARIKTAFLGEELLTVQTLSGVYDNMAIEAMPHDESPESVGVLVMSMKLKEIKLVQAQFQALPPQKVQSKNDASTVNRGEQTQKGNKSMAAAGNDDLIGGYLNPGGRPGGNSGGAGGKF